MAVWNEARAWFQRAVENYQRPLTRYVRHILRNLEAARDIVQETFLRLWKNGPVEGERPLRIWLYRTARNQAIDFLRKEGRVRLLEESGENELICPHELPVEKLEKDQARKILLKQMESLPEKYQEVLRLKFQEELSYQEISEITGHSVSHVGVLLHTAIMNLRGRLS